MKRRASFGVALIAFLLIAVPAAAQTTDVTLDIELDVVGSCQINGGNATALLDFGSKPAGAFTGTIDAQTAAGAISVLCNVSSTAGSFSIGPGQNDLGAQRNLVNPLVVGPLGSLAYRLFADAGRTPASEYLPDIKLPINGGVITTGTPFEITIYGRIEETGTTNLIAGRYADQAVGTLAF